MLSWNIAGIGKVIKIKNYLSEFDIVMLQETWLERKNEREWLGKLGKGFNWVAKEAKRENKRGRAKGGVLVGIKKRDSL